MGYLNLLGWVVLKTDVSLSDEMKEPLVQLCPLTEKNWEGLVNTHNQRRMLFPSDCNDNCFKKNVDVPFQILEKKFKYYFLSQYIIWK